MAHKELPQGVNSTEGSVVRGIVRFSLPYLLSYLLQTLYGMADLFIIGQFDPVAATTAVSIGSQVMHMLTVILVGLAMGATVSIGQAVGAKKDTSPYIGGTVTLFLALSIVLTGILCALIRPITSVMATPAEAVDGTVSYLLVCFLGIPFITAYNIISSIFRGMGDSRRPMYFIAVACVCNIALDYLFIGALSLGPTGAALGTTIAQAISVLLSLLVIRSHGKEMGIRLQKRDLVPDKAVLGRILRIGFPIAMQDGLIQIAFIIITVIANWRRLNDAAAVGIVEKFISFVFLVPSSMLSTVSALGAQNIGAGKPERARQTLYTAIAIAAGFGLVIALLIQQIAEPVVALFTNAADSAEVVRLGGEYLRGYIWDALFAGIHFCFSGYFCACGRSELSFLHNISAIALVRIPGVYFASLRYPDTLFPMGIATACGSLTSVIICVAAFLLLRKKERESI